MSLWARTSALDEWLQTKEREKVLDLGTLDADWVSWGTGYMWLWCCVILARSLTFVIYWFGELRRQLRAVQTGVHRLDFWPLLWSSGTWPSNRQSFCSESLSSQLLTSELANSGGCIRSCSKGSSTTSQQVGRGSGSITCATFFSFTFIALLIGMKEVISTIFVAFELLLPSPFGLFPYCFSYPYPFPFFGANVRQNALASGSPIQWRRHGMSPL